MLFDRELWAEFCIRLYLFSFRLCLKASGSTVFFSFEYSANYFFKYCKMANAIRKNYLYSLYTSFLHEIQ